MRKSLKNIHWLFWGCIPIFLIYGFVSKSDIDINIHDTLLVIGERYIVFFVSFIFFISGLGYYLTYQNDKFKPVNALTISHAILMFVGLAILVFVPQFSYESRVDGTEDMMINHSESMSNFNLRQSGWLGLFVAQPIFLINLFVSIFRK